MHKHFRIDRDLLLYIIENYLGPLARRLGDP